MATGEIPASNVTVADLYHEIAGLRADVTAALTRMERSDERGASFERVQSDHETRLRTLETAVPSSLEGRMMALEKFRWQVAGALIVINALSILVEWALWAPKR